MASVREILAHLANVGTPLDRDAAVRTSVGLDETLGRFQAETFPFLMAGGSEIKFIHGANGRGKTHFLLAVQDLARARGFVTARVECPQGHSPFAELRETYQMVAEQITAPGKRNSDGVSKSGVTNVIAARFSKLSKEKALELLNSVRSSKHLAPDFRNLVIAYAQGLVQNSLTSLARQSLEALLLGSSTYRVSVTELYKSDKGLPKPLGKLGARNAGNWIRSLLSLPRALGYPGALIMFDETERAFHDVGYWRAQQQLANLRNLVDYCALGTLSGSMIMYSASEDFLDFARVRLDALAQRIEPTLMQSGTLGRNPRSTWVDLDDLTNPATSDPEFFQLLAKKILTLGPELGITADRQRKVTERLLTLAEATGKSLAQGNVRKFVKAAATTMLLEAKGRG